jgi:hypothetical protein
LIPFGAYVRDPDKDWGSMAIKTLPIGAIGDIDTPVFRLNRRVEMAMYDYYLVHLKYLFLLGTTVDGSWTDETDLREKMEPDLLASISNSK